MLQRFAVMSRFHSPMLVAALVAALGVSFATPSHAWAKESAKDREAASSETSEAKKGEQSSSKKDDGKDGGKSDKATKKKPKFNADDVAKLAPLQTYVGMWRGVGSKRRGDTDGAWLEQTHWQWVFEDDRAMLGFDADDAKYFESGRLIATDKKNVFSLVMTLPDGETTQTFTGGVSKSGTLVLIDSKAAEGRPAKITIQLIARGKRMLTLLEKRIAKDSYTQMGMIGYTRRGSGFGKANTAATECVVTGGYSTGGMTYKGKSYPICCGGCRDMFKEDPEKVLAEFKQRKEAEKKKAESKG